MKKSQAIRAHKSQCQPCSMCAAGLLSAVAFISIGERIELLSYVWAGARERRTFTQSSSFCIELLMKIFAVSANPSVGGTRRSFLACCALEPVVACTPLLSATPVRSTPCYTPAGKDVNLAYNITENWLYAPCDNVAAINMLCNWPGSQQDCRHLLSRRALLGHRGVACQTMVKEMKG